MSILKIAENYLPSMIEVRRYLHMNPEVSYHAKKTKNYLLDKVSQYDSVEINDIPDTLSFVVTVGSGNPHIAFRADFDALPIPDETETPYKSTIEGVSHACGHDAHTSTLLHFLDAVINQRESLNGRISFIFQDAEELLPGSAISIVKSKALEDVDKVYGQHYWSGIEVGTVKVKPDEIIAAPDRLEITIQGSGGHAAYPSAVVDPIVIAAEVITSLQTVVSRQISPLDNAVVSFGQVLGGEAFNVIPNEVHLYGTVRTFKKEIAEKIEEIITRECEMIAKKRGATADVRYLYGFPAVINHEAEADIVKRAVEALDFNFEVPEPLMIGEDFAYYLQHKKGAFFLTGSRNGESTTHFPHHSSQFDIDENAMLYGLSTFMKIAELEEVITWKSHN